MSRGSVSAGHLSLSAMNCGHGAAGRPLRLEEGRRPPTGPRGPSHLRAHHPSIPTHEVRSMQYLKQFSYGLPLFFFSNSMFGVTFHVRLCCGRAAV